jgi:radical SAM protein with 4Fe4S-binding SPASM domain
LESQIHTTVTRHVQHELPRIAELLAEYGIKLWALFLLIAVGRAARPEIRRLNLNARQIESLFHWLYGLSSSAPYDVTPREGYHYRRVLLQRRAAELGVSARDLLANAEAKEWTPVELVPSGRAGKIVRAPLGVNDGKGILFISHTGDVQPSGFLNLVGGNIRSRSLADIYRNSDVFIRVRDYTELKGKCGFCEFKSICGGSRSRAYALTGDPMRSDPFCVYQPEPWRLRRGSAGPQSEKAARAPVTEA